MTTPARRLAATIASAAVLALPLSSLAASAGAAPVGSAAVDAVATPKAASSATVKKFKNCTALNKTYKHGVGKRGAKDKHSKSSKAVTSFKVSDKTYQANKSMDRDKDGIACEKR